MRTKIIRLEDAFNGHFGDHHRFLLTRMLHRIDGIDADIAALDNRSRRIWPLSPRRPPDWMTSPASGRSRPRPSSPRLGWTCRASRLPGTCVPGPSSPRGCLSRFISSTEARQAMTRTLDEFRPGIVLIHGLYQQLTPSVLAPIAARRIPIASVHDYKLLCPGLSALHARARGVRCAGVE
jgi:hypothetical protein